MWPLIFIATLSGIPAVLDVLRNSDKPLSKKAIEKALTDSDHSREAVRKAVGVAPKRGQVVPQEGGQAGGVCYALAGKREPLAVDEAEKERNRASVLDKVHLPKELSGAPKF